MTKRNKKRLTFTIIAILVLALIIFCAIIPIYKKAKAPTRENSATNRVTETGLNSAAGSSATSSFDQKDNSSTNTGTASNQSSSDQSSSTSTPNAALTAEDYFNHGLKNTTEKNYASAITNFSKAIELNPKVSDYYSKKAEAEVSAGNKAAAINTVNAGLQALPGDEQLQNKLDIINATVK